MRILAYSPGPPSRSDAIIQQLAKYLKEKNHSIGWRYFGAYALPDEPGKPSPDFENADAVITIGWNHNIYQIHKDQVNAGKVSYSISDGFVRRGWKPGAYFAATRNGLHAYGDRIQNLPGDRWAKLGVKLLAWRKPDDKQFILVGHQHTPAYNGADRQAYFMKTIELLKEYCPDREIVVRIHPRDRQRAFVPKGTVISNRPLIEDLMGSWAVVTYDSNIAVDAVLFGVPVFTQGKTMADPIACHDLARIVDPPTPDRQQWAHDLAWSQWNVVEQRAGLPWIHLINGWIENKPSGLADPVGTPAVESDYEYETEPERLLDQLTDWNVQDGQTAAQVVAEIMNPKYNDKIKVRRARFEGMSDEELKIEAGKRSLDLGDRYERSKLVERLIHASL